MGGKKKVLVGTALFNWSETQRMVYVAEELSIRGCHIIWIGNGKYDYLIKDLDCERIPMDSDKKWYVRERIEKMMNLDIYGNNYGMAEEIQEVVEEECRIIRQCNPDVLLTGYRSTLTVSSKITGVPLVWCLSAVVSPIFFQKGLATIPADIKVNHFLSNITDQKQKEQYFAKFAYMNALGNNKTSKEWNKCLRNYNLPEFHNDMSIFEGTLNLMSDAEELFAEFEGGNKKYTFCGPFQPRDEVIPLPDWLLSYKKGNRKIILVMMGSSGIEEILRETLDCLVGLDYDIFISTMGKLKEYEKNYPKNFYFAEKFPIRYILNMVDGCVIHGGQGTMYSVAFAGKPFIGIPMFNEQQYNLLNIVKKYHSGIVVLKNEINQKNIQHAVTEIMTDEQYSKRAKNLKRDLKKYTEAGSRVAQVIAADKILIFLDELDQRSK